MLDALSKPFLALGELERVREAIRLQLQNNDNQTKKGTRLGCFYTFFIFLRMQRIIPLSIP